MNKHYNQTLTVFESHPLFQYLLLALITLAAVFLRLYKLGEWSFWGDEAFSLGNSPDGFIQSTTTSLIHMTIAALGTSEWSARLAPALIGILSIPIAYFPIKRQFGSATALIAAALLAVSPWHLYWSQNARFYILLLLFYTLALFTSHIGLEEDNPWFFIASLIFLGLAAKERLLALMFIPVVIFYLSGLWLFRFERPRGLRWRNLAILFVPMAILGLIFTGPYLRDLPAWLRSFARINTNPFWLLAGSVYYLGLPTVFMAACGSVFFLSQKNRAALLFTMGAVIPLCAVMLISLFHYAANRYIFISLTSWIILAALASAELFRQLKGSLQIFAFGILGLMLVASASENILYFKYQNGNRENGKAAYAFIRERKGEGDLVVTDRPEVGGYYLQGEVVGYRNLTPEILGQYERVWFVEDLNVEELFPEILSWLQNNTQQVANFDVHANARLFKMRVYLYDPPGSPP